MEYFVKQFVELTRNIFLNFMYINIQNTIEIKPFVIQYNRIQYKHARCCSFQPFLVHEIAEISFLSDIKIIKQQKIQGNKRIEITRCLKT